jgi:SAM-dependent methyltransferase
MTRYWDLRADELSGEAIGRGEPTAWFDRLYAEGAAGSVSMPWDRTGPHALLEAWTATHAPDGSGRRAAVVGCGLGADAAHLARLGFDTLGFDLSETAVGIARERHGDTGAEFRVVDLLDLPAELVGGFDLVVEIFTLQAIPDPPRTQAASAIRSLVAAGGTLLAVAFRPEGGQPLDQGPPFPLPRETMSGLAVDGLTLVALEEVADPGGARWRAEYRR